MIGGITNTGTEHIPTDINEMSQIDLLADALATNRSVPPDGRGGADELVLPAQLIIKCRVR